MHYKIGRSNARFNRAGKPNPPYMGVTVLLDYIAPLAAQAYRRLNNKFIAEQSAAWQSLPWPRPDGQRALVDAKIAKIRKRHLHAFARLIAKHLPK